MNGREVFVPSSEGKPMKFKDVPKEKVPPYDMPAALILALASCQRPSVTDETIEEIEDYEEDL